jgi:hypothetical protein
VAERRNLKPGASSVVVLGNRPPGGARSQDGAQVHRAWSGAADVWPRPPQATKIAPFSRYLRERLAAFPQLTGRRLHRELRELGYAGGYRILTDFLREIGPIEPAPFEVCFETSAGRQAQVDFAHFRTVFADQPGTERAAVSLHPRGLPPPANSHTPREAFHGVAEARSWRNVL